MKAEIDKRIPEHKAAIAKLDGHISKIEAALNES
jgi:hypothetical protein